LLTANAEWGHTRTAKSSLGVENAKMQPCFVFYSSLLRLLNLAWLWISLAMADPTLHKALSAALDTSVFLPGTSGYNDSTTSYYSVFENNLKPLLALKPTSKEGVAAIVTIVKPFAGSGQVKLAIRGGGATPAAGVANINNGITIDMRSLTGVTISSDKKTVSIGAGE
jgi:FAD binding domain